VLTHISELRERTMYTARNQGETSQTLVIEHPARPDWRLAKGTKEPDEKAPGEYRFRVEVPPHGTASMPVEEVTTQAMSYQLSALNENQISLFEKQGTITPEMAKAFDKITAQKAEVARLEEEMEARQKDIDRIVEDQGRLRENMKALRGTAEEKALVQRYTKQLDEQENQLEALRKNIQATEVQRDKANAELEKLIEDLQIEASL
jgi:DNA repair exonuclease SbcCD ATPase subunit